MDPDPGGPKTYGSDGSGSSTLFAKSGLLSRFRLFWPRKKKKAHNWKKKNSDIFWGKCRRVFVFYFRLSRITSRHEKLQYSGEITYPAPTLKEN
jgi:hypothetical protein